MRKVFEIRVRPFAAVLFFFCLSSVPPASRGAKKPGLSFVRGIVDPAGPKDPWDKMVGDLDGDGHADIVIGGAKGPLVSYTWPDWKKAEIAPGGYNGVDGETGDVDGDGDIDIVMGGVVWFENPRLRGDPARPWTLHRIDDYEAHDVMVGDLDHDGRLDVVARDQSAFGAPVRGSKILVYRQDGPDKWSKRVLDCPEGEGLKLADIDKDGDLDVIVQTRWYENDGEVVKGSWTAHVYTTKWTHPNTVVEVADLNGDKRPDVVLAPSELAKGFYRLAWYEAPRDSRKGDWTEHEIASPVETVVHGLGVADLDGDGQVDIVTAEMHQGADPDEVIAYLNHGRGASWQRQVLSGQGSHKIKLADFDDDGDVDILGANWSGPYQPIELWENQTRLPVPVTALGQSAELVMLDWNPRVITKAQNGFPTTPGLPPAANGDWTTPVDFAGGTLQHRLEIRRMPKPKTMMFQLCLHQDGIKKEICGASTPLFRGPIGDKPVVVTWSAEISKMWKQDGVPIDWSSGRGSVYGVIKRGKSEGDYISSYKEVNNGVAWAGENPDDWYPMEVRLTVVAVAKGAKFSGWQRYVQRHRSAIR